MFAYSDIYTSIPAKYIDLWYPVANNRIRILTIKQGCVEVNEIVAAIWHLINGMSSVEDIVCSICKKYPNTTIDLVRNDVCQVIQSLVNLEAISLDWHSYLEED